MGLVMSPHIAISPDNKLLAVPGPEITIYAIEYTETLKSEKPGNRKG
jgi:hypothetical protein